MKNFNKIFFSGAFIIVFGAYAIYSKLHSKSADTALNTQSADTASQQVDTTPTPSQQTSANTETLNPGTGVSNTDSGSSVTGTFKNGTFTGKVTDAFYGNYQVAAVIKGGKLSDVKFLVYPNDRSQSIAINTDAIPTLKSEAISSQSANVNIVSGATQSSKAFQESLASALSQARS